MLGLVVLKYKIIILIQADPWPELIVLLSTNTEYVPFLFFRIEYAHSVLKSIK